MSDKKIKILLLTTLLIIFSLFFAIVFLNNKKVNESSSGEPNEFVIVSNYNLFFFVNQNINRFLNYRIANNSQAVLNNLDLDFRRENDITLSNMNQYVGTYQENDRFVPNFIKSYSINDAITVYYTTGKIVNEGFEDTVVTVQSISYLLFADYNNMTMSVQPLDASFSEEAFVKNISKDKSIPKSSYNEFEQIELIDTNHICIMYHTDFLKKLYRNLSEAYEVVTNFDSYDDFEKFIQLDEMSSTIKSCNQSFNKENQRIYDIVDSAGYRYVFTEKNIFDYTVSLKKN